MSILEESITSLHEKLKNRDITSRSLVEACFANIEKTDGEVKAFLRTDKEAALEQAEAIDAKFDKGESLTPLAGIPYAMKDNVSYKGRKLTCGSQLMKDYVGMYDATLAKRLKANDAVLVGQLNMDEFAMGSSTENSSFFTTRNPWNTDYVPGGSSGGSSASVSARHAIYSFGSDTGGSIRQPAAFCNLVGLKPTYGRISRYGLVAFGSSLDQLGPFTKTVDDCAHIMNAVYGHDPLDSTSANEPVPDYTQCLKGDVKGMKIGVPRSLMSDDFSPVVLEKIQDVIEQYKAMGATFEMIDMDSFSAALDTYYLLAPSEVSSNLARFDGVRFTSRNMDADNLRDMYFKSRGDGFGTEVKRRIILGTFSLSAGSYQAYYQKAQQMRTLVVNEFKEVFSKYDLILSPSTPTPPFKVGDVSDPLTMYLNDLGTIPANIGGVPAISIPCGFADNMPIGVHLMADFFREDIMMNAAYAYQQATDHHLKIPAIVE